MRVGITARFEKSKHNNLWYAFEEELLKTLTLSLPKCELIFISPLNVPDLTNVDLLFFSGGSTPGEDLVRDHFELELYRKMVNDKKPVIGICRGAQLFGVDSGATLQSVKGHVKRVRETIGHHAVGTCFHNWGFQELGPKWNVLSRDALDNSIELFRHESYPILGVMSHPERNRNGVNFMQSILDLLG